METIQRSFNDWERKATVKKGNVGERLVRDYLERRGFIVYEPQTEGAHGFDKLAILNKRQAIIVECKSKARRNKYADTGINIKHLNEYQYISEKHNLPVFIFFVDEMLGKIYGNTLKELLMPRVVDGKQYPSRENGIIYFPLINTKWVCNIGTDDIELMKANATRNYDYA
jgi:hypothetical protein